MLEVVSIPAQVKYSGTRYSIKLPSLELDGIL